MKAVRALLAGLAAVALAGVSAGGCGGDGDDGDGSDPHLETVLAAAQKAVDAGTARAELEFVTEAEGPSPSFSATERIDFRSAQAQGVIEFERFPGIPPKANAGLYSRASEVYARYDFVKGRPWIRLPSDPLADLTTNPVGMVEAFELALSDVSEIGETAVDGEEAIRYAGTYDIEALLATLPEDDRERLGQRLAALESLETPVTVLVDADGYLRQAYYDFGDLIPGEASMSISYELSDFGVDVSFDPPRPEDIITLRELMARTRQAGTPS
jgi:hypothetical protein